MWIEQTLVGASTSPAISAHPEWQPSENRTRDFGTSKGVSWEKLILGEDGEPELGRTPLRRPVAGTMKAVAPPQEEGHDISQSWGWGHIF